MTSSLIAQQFISALEQARQLIINNNFTAAQAILLAAIHTSKEPGEAHFLLGFVYFREHDARQSLAEYTLGAASRRPTAAEFRVIGADYVLLKDFADASRWFEEATTQEPLDPSGWYLLGRSKYNEGDYLRAAECFQRVLAIHPSDVKAEDNLGLAYQALNRLPEARKAFETAISFQQVSPSKSGAPFLDLGELLLQDGQPAKAAEALRSAVLLSPSNPRAHEQLGLALRQIDNVPEARIELEKAVALAPDSSPAHFELGQVYRRLGLKEQAAHELELCQWLTATHSSVEVPNYDTSQDPGLP
jgi:tetratricopeptide (TPR) repeat protein